MAYKTFTLDDGTVFNCLEVSYDKVNFKLKVRPQEFSALAVATYSKELATIGTFLPNRGTVFQSTNGEKWVKWEVVKDDILAPSSDINCIKQTYDTTPEDGGQHLYLWMTSQHDTPLEHYENGFITIAHYFDDDSNEDKFYTLKWGGNTFPARRVQTSSTSISTLSFDADAELDLNGIPLDEDGYIDPSYLNIGTTPVQSLDPYAKGGYSDIEGGAGTFNKTSDIVGFSDQAMDDATINESLVTLFTGGLTELKNLAKFIWSSDFFDQILKLFADPMDVIISVNILPIELPREVTRQIYVGNIGTTVIMWQVDGQYRDIDFGTIKIERYYDGALDFDAKIRIYLPFIGFRDLDPAEVMGCELGLRYRVDLLSGSIVAEITSDGNVLYIFEGNCATNIPLTGRSYSQFISAVFNALAVGVGAAAIGGGLAPAGVAGAIGQMVKSARPTYNHNGNVSSTYGLMSQQTPYVVIELPDAVVPKDNTIYNGYPSNITETLGNLSGWTVIRDIHLEGFGALSDELTELEQILKGGILL